MPERAARAAGGSRSPACCCASPRCSPGARSGRRSGRPSRCAGRTCPLPRLRAGDRPRSGAAARARSPGSRRWSSATAPARWPPPCPPRRTACCGSSCALLTVEADPAQPGLGRTRIGLMRVGLADAPADRPPLLVVGDSATQPSATGAAALAGQVPVELLRQYSLVGIDRRGAGIDDLDCGPAVARSAFVNIDPGGDGALPQLNPLLEQARLVVQDCYLVHSGALSGYRTASTAADVEQVRAALGVTRLSALGRRRRRHRGDACGRGPTPARSAGSSSTGRPTPRWTSPTPPRPARRPPSRRSTRSPRPAPPSRRARSAPTPVARSRPSSTACAASRSPPPTDGG